MNTNQADGDARQADNRSSESIAVEIVNAWTSGDTQNARNIVDSLRSEVQQRSGEATIDDAIAILKQHYGRLYGRRHLWRLELRDDEEEHDECDMWAYKLAAVDDCIGELLKHRRKINSASSSLDGDDS